jgi:hypothetical protein
MCYWRGLTDVAGAWLIVREYKKGNGSHFYDMDINRKCPEGTKLWVSFHNLLTDLDPPFRHFGS